MKTENLPAELRSLASALGGHPRVIVDEAASYIELLKKYNDEMMQKLHNSYTETLSKGAEPAQNDDANGWDILRQIGKVLNLPDEHDLRNLPEVVRHLVNSLQNERRMYGDRVLAHADVSAYLRDQAGLAGWKPLDPGCQPTADDTTAAVEYLTGLAQQQVRQEEWISDALEHLRAMQKGQPRNVMLAGLIALAPKLGAS